LQAVVAWRTGTFPANVQPLGWIGAIFGGLLTWFGASGFGPAVLHQTGIALLIVGLVVVVLFSSDRKADSFLSTVLKLVDGLQSLANITKIFGDVLSYMRLFALGLASASLAITFNQLADQIQEALPGLGLLLSILVLVLGHAINLLLGIVGGFVHCLLLNFKEHAARVSSGVEALINRLRDEGVSFRVADDIEGGIKLRLVDQDVTLDIPVARIRDMLGKVRSITLAQQWPARRSIAEMLLRNRFSERLYPSEPLITTQCMIDTFFPIARGGTGCIPGPFGAGKTVLQHLISRYSDVDIVIVVACGERAGEVVKTITEFPKLKDPRGGGSLMDRAIIICNTSSMPVAAREASIYTGITLGEYYRQKGYDVLLMADSTSRWAQAMRETSGRMEEIPGEEPFPAYLDSSIKGVYERAGIIRTNDGTLGSLTMIGTVSPAGGNFEEPVTQSTLATAKTFLGLSAERAYKRFYPAVDLLLSWSRYLDQLSEWTIYSFRVVGRDGSRRCLIYLGVAMRSWK
jgi:F0F1-type ATP synthase beta subunit